jgi:hypothetical protein
MKKEGSGNRSHPVGFSGTPRFDELVKSQISDGFEKSPQARRANPEE